VQQVLTELKPRILGAGAEISVGELPTVSGVPDRFHCLFTHLIDNALKFAAPGMPPRVKIHASLGPQPIVYVEDRGMGIDKDEQAKIFEPLHRRHEGTVIEGAGLGLATCKQIVQQLGGRIELESERGYGARFIIRFDRAGTSENPAATRSN
jgi:signal transduction histidine kinase